MNKQTRSYKKQGFSRKVVKGASSDKGKLNGGLAIDIPYEVFKGKPCITAFADRASNPMNKRKSARRIVKNDKKQKSFD